MTNIEEKIFSEAFEKQQIDLKVIKPQLPITNDNIIYFDLDNTKLYSLDNSFQITQNEFDALLHKLSKDILNDRCFGFFGFRQDPDLNFAGFLIKSIRRVPKNSVGYKVGIQILDNDIGKSFKTLYDNFNKSIYYLKLDANFYDKNKFHSFVLRFVKKLENEI